MDLISLSTLVCLCARVRPGVNEQRVSVPAQYLYVCSDVSLLLGTCLSITQSDTSSSSAKYNLHAPSEHQICAWRWETCPQVELDRQPQGGTSPRCHRFLLSRRLPHNKLSIIVSYGNLSNLRVALNKTCLYTVS